MNSLNFLIRAKLDSLPQSERKIASYILREQKQIMYKNINELASCAGSSQSAVIRLCKSLGIPGFQELKMMLARDVFSGTEPGTVETVDGTADPQISGIMGNVLSSLTQSLEDLASMLDPATFGTAAEAIEKATFIQFLGVGTSSIVALDFYHKLARLGYRCGYIQDIDLQVSAACNVQRGDLAVIVSYTGETGEILRAAREVRENGGTILSLTKGGYSSLASLSDIVLSIPVSESLMRQGASSSRIAQLVLIDILFSVLVSRRTADSMKSLERTLRATGRKK